jgi:hypothetical protein
MTSETETWPAVEWPVVMIDGGDVFLFQEHGDLQGGLEPWMAYEDGAAFYDARGRKLRSGVALDNVTVMVDPCDENSHADDVLPVLRAYLGAAGRTSPVDSAPLRKFIEQLEAR